MSKKIKDYDESDFEEPKSFSQKSPIKKKRVEPGLSITRLGRISLTTGLQLKLGIDPIKRDKLTFVEVRAHKAESGDDRYTFSLRFYDYHDGVNGPGHTVYKPKRKGVTNNTSYIEFARYLKKKGLIKSVGEAKNYLTPGHVDIVPNGIKSNRTLIINLKSRFEK